MAGLQLLGGFLPITALEYMDESLLMAGEGPFLKLFSKKGQLLCWSEAFPFGVLYGIRPLQHAMVFGQKNFRLVRIMQRATGDITLQYKSEVVELADWILDVKWLRWTNPDNYEIILVTTHNVLVSYKVSNKASECKYYCSEVSCILYSAVIAGKDLVELMVASGTVFNQILLWCLTTDCNKPEPVKVYFNGHQGVIFSVKFNDDNSKLVSASDDRSVRVWTIPPEWKEMERVQMSSCLLLLYGHTARVWDARLLPNCIISIGEDATCRVWSYDGRTTNIFRGHKGKSIWSFAIDRMNRIVATGGGDCSIRMYTLEDSPQNTTHCCRLPSMTCSSSQSVPPAPRWVFLLGPTALCLTDHGQRGRYAGNVFGAKIALFRMLRSCHAGRLDVDSSSVAMSQVHYDSDFSGYSVGALLGSSQLLALGNVSGSIKLVRLDRQGNVHEVKLINAYDGKVFSLHWCPGQVAGCEFLFSCGPNGIIICWKIKLDPFEVVKREQLSLPPSKHRWPTTFTLLTPPTWPNHILLCGDRRGSLHLYQPSMDATEPPRQTLHGIHGPNGVTHSCIHEEFIYTCGRNGLCRKFELRANGELVELVKFKPVKGVNWLEKMVFVTGDMLLIGFHGTDLVLHSTLQNRTILSVPCGGGHRSYAISSIQEIIDRLWVNVLFVKQGRVCHCKVAINSCYSGSLIQEPFVGREAISMVLLHGAGMSGRGFVAVGSEDTSICVLPLPDVEQLSSSSLNSLEVLLTLQGHTSAVKALSTCHSREKLLLFSGGARASLRVWSLQESRIPGKKVEAGLDGELYLHEPIKKKVKFEPSGVEVSPECRIMSLTSFSLTEVFPVSQEAHVDHCHYVMAGCSDAVIRQYVYNDNKKLFSPRPTLKCSEKCVLSVKHFFHQQENEPNVDILAQSDDHCVSWRRPLLCCAATDGYVTIWDLSPFLLRYPHHPVSDSHHNLSPAVRFQIHQSGINDMAILDSSYSYLLASAGDDGALAVTCFMVETRPPQQDCCLTVNVAWQLVEHMAHSSAITGISFVGEDLIMSSSIDQRLNVWRFTKDGEVELAWSCTHDVADASSLLTHSNKAGKTVAILCGIGMQYFKFSADAISTKGISN